MKPFTIDKIAPYLFRIVMPGNVFSYLAEGEKSAVLIDTGFGLGHYREYIEDILKGKPYVLVLTHGHLDHAGGASEFDTVYMDLKDLDLAKRHTQKEIRMTSFQNDPVTADDFAEPKEDGYLPLEYGQIFDIGGEELEIICLGGHTPGSVGILFRNERILLAGDACCSFTLMFGKNESLTVREYKKNLEGVREKYRDDFDRMVYSHPHNFGGKEVLDEMIELCGEILDGKDDHICVPSPLGGESFIAKAVNEKNIRSDGKTANLMYSKDCLD